MDIQSQNQDPNLAQNQTQPSDQSSQIMNNQTDPTITESQPKTSASQLIGKHLRATHYTLGGDRKFFLFI